MTEKSNNAQTVVINTDKKEENKGCILAFHLFMTLITGGLWLFVMLGWKIFKSLAN